MEIQELPDYKARHSEVDKYLDEPLFEYVWKVADKFVADYDGEDFCPSKAPIIFANRYISSRLTNEEKYSRYQEIYPESDPESAIRHYEKWPELDISFREKFLRSKEVLKTLKAFNLDLSKFWYLLLFVIDLVKDMCINAPTHETSEIEKVNNLLKGILDATEITTKKDGWQNYESKDEFTLLVLKMSISYYIKTYNNIINTSKDDREVKARLKELGLTDTIKDWVAINFDERITLDKSHRTRLFTEMFQYFLKDMEADRGLVEHFGSEDSTDKLLLISRLAHIVGLQEEDYYKRRILNKQGKYVANRRLSNLLSRYRSEPLPKMTGRLYSGWL